MTDKQLVVQVRRDGSVHAETIGMHGAECLDYISVLEDLLEADTLQSAFTDDYHRTGLEQSADTTVEDRDAFGG